MLMYSEEIHRQIKQEIRFNRGDDGYWPGICTSKSTGADLAELNKWFKVFESGCDMMEYERGLIPQKALTRIDMALLDRRLELRAVAEKTGYDRYTQFVNRLSRESCEPRERRNRLSLLLIDTLLSCSHVDLEDIHEYAYFTKDSLSDFLMKYKNTTLEERYESVAESNYDLIDNGFWAGKGTCQKISEIAEEYELHVLKNPEEELLFHYE